MTLVVDASVALKWFVAEEGSEQAANLLASSELLIAPELIVAEVCSAGWKAVRTGAMLVEQCEHMAARLAVAFDELASIVPLAPHALSLARAIDHPVYDCFYLALAEERDVQLVTADRRLMQRLSRDALGKRVLALHSVTY